MASPHCSCFDRDGIFGEQAFATVGSARRSSPSVQFIQVQKAVALHSVPRVAAMPGPAGTSSTSSSSLSQGQRLIVVSNRLPVTIKRGEDGEWTFSMSSGGLVSALSGCKKQMDFTWIGWPGQLKLWLEPWDGIEAELYCIARSPGVDVPENEREAMSKRLMDEYSCLPVYVSDEIADRHYNGFSNSILWPLFHYRASCLIFLSPPHAYVS